MVIMGLKEALRSWNLRRLWWCSTRDMVADGLNKGLVPRTALLELASTGIWVLKDQCKLFQEVQHHPIESSTDFAKLDLASTANWLAVVSWDSLGLVYAQLAAHVLPTGARQ